MQGSRQRLLEGSVRVGVRLGLASCNVESTDSVASALAHEAEVLGLRRRPCWSVAELRLGEAGFELLLAWLESLDPDRARRDRETSSQGFVLLALASEAARRLVGTGEVWPALARLNMQDETRHVLFAGGAAPRPYVRDSISKAASRLGLRSAMSAGQPWYATIVLQFGLSLRGIETLLARWGAQGLPESLDPLRFGPQRSDEFETTWAAIRALGDPALADDARTSLETSCWVLPSWIDALATAAHEAVRQTRSSSTDRAFSIFDGVRVTWSATTPRLSLHLRRLEADESARLELDAGRYDVVVDGEVFTRLYRDAGALVPATPSIEELPPASAFSVTLVDRAGRVGHSEECATWDESSPAEAFDREGRRVVPAGARRIETLVYERGGSLLPADVSASTASFGARLASVLRTDQVSLRWDDGTTWSPARMARPSTPALALRPETSARLGEPLRLLTTTAVVEVERPEGWRVAEDGAIEGTIPFDASPSLRGRVRTKDGNARAFEANLALSGEAIRRRGEWCAVPEELEARDVTELAWRVFASDAPRGEVRLFAGARAIGRWGSLGAARRIRDRPLGRGEALGWLDGARCLTSDDEPTWIAPCVVDRGNVVDGEWRNGLLHLRWRTPQETTGVTLLAWTYGGLEIVSPESCEAAGREWLVPFAQEPFALTVSFDGARLGSWWTRGWYEALGLLETSDLVERVALFARVAGLPILAPGAIDACRELGRRWPVEVARTWWLDEAAPSLCDDVVDAMSAMAVQATSRIDEWRAVQRELFVDAAFDPARSDDVLMVVGLRDDGSAYVPTGLVRMAALGIPWAGPFFEGQREFLAKDRLKRRRGESLLDSSRLELLDAMDSKQARTREAVLERDLARELGVSRQRVRALIENQTTPVPFAKRVALASRDFALASALHALRPVSS